MHKDSAYSPKKFYATNHLFILIGGLFFLFIPIKWPIFVYDEGFALFNAARVMTGDVPHRDFWAVYPPGQSYTLALLFNIFGDTALVARVYDTLIRFVIAVSLYAIARQLTTQRYALSVYCIAIFWLAGSLFYAYAMFPALAWSGLALWGMLNYMTTKRQCWLFISGVLAGASSLYRLDVGIYVLLNLGLTTIILVVQSYREANFSTTFSFANFLHSTARTSGLFVVGFAIISLPFYIYLAVVAGADRLWTDLILFPATTFREVRALPYPPPIPELFRLWIEQAPLVTQYLTHDRWLRFYCPLAIYALSIVVLFRNRKAFSQTKWTSLFVTTLFGILLFLQALSRFDESHVLPSMLFAIIALVTLCDYLSREFGYRYRLHWAQMPRLYSVALIIGGGLFALVFSPYIITPLERLIRTPNPFDCHSSLDRAGCIAVSSELEETALYIRANTAADEPIFVGNDQHDRIFINDVSFYFLVDRPSATRYHELHPGVATTLPVQQEIVNEMQLKGVRWVVQANWEKYPEPNGSSVSSGVTYLDDYIQAEYEPSAEFGRYTVLHKYAQ